MLNEKLINRGCYGFIAPDGEYISPMKVDDDGDEEALFGVMYHLWLEEKICKDIGAPENEHFNLRVLERRGYIRLSNGIDVRYGLRFYWDEDKMGIPTENQKITMRVLAKELKEDFDITIDNGEIDND